MTEVTLSAENLSPSETHPNSQARGTTPAMSYEGLVARTLTSLAELTAIEPAWSTLSQNASRSNAFYEPAFFLAATTHLTPQEQWQIVVISDAISDELVGFFPFVRQCGFCGLSKLSLWQSDLTYLTTPLIKSGVEANVFHLLLQHLKSMSPRVDYIEFQQNEATGRVHQELHTLIRDNLLMTFQVDHYSRAELRSTEDYECYVKSSVGGHHFRGFGRQLRGLRNLGQVEFRSIHDSKLANCSANWFLDLEAKGWKGVEGTAMQQQTHEAAFFHELVCRGLEQKRVEMLGLFLNGEPIAMACTLLSQQGGFTYKIAFDESYKKYSPGILLQLHITQRQLEEASTSWLDSCAVANHPMINRLWKERRSIQHILVSTGRALPNLILGTMPLLRAIKRIVFKHKAKSQ